MTRQHATCAVSALLAAAAVVATSVAQDGALTAAVTESLAPLMQGADLPDAATVRELVTLTLRLLPGMAYLSLLLVAVLGYRVAQFVSLRTEQPLPAPLPLRQ